MKYLVFFLSLAACLTICPKAFSSESDALQAQLDSLLQDNRECHIRLSVCQVTKDHPVTKSHTETKPQVKVEILKDSPLTAPVKGSDISTSALEPEPISPPKDENNNNLGNDDEDGTRLQERENLRAVVRQELDDSSAMADQSGQSDEE